MYICTIFCTVANEGEFHILYIMYMLYQAIAAAGLSGQTCSAINVPFLYRLYTVTGVLHILYNVYDVSGYPRRRTVGLILFSLEFCTYGTVDLCIAQ